MYKLTSKVVAWAELVTIRYYDDETISRTTQGMTVLLDHRTATSAQLVVKQ